MLDGLSLILRGFQGCFHAAATKCSKCSAILDGQYVKIDGKEVCLKCFICKQCQQDLTSGYFLFSGETYCQEHYQRQLESAGKAILCARCKKGIFGKYMEADTHAWHAECYVCDTCNNPITGGFFEEDQKLWCQGCLETRHK